MTKFVESDSGQYVRYTGTANERKISKADWKAVDIDHDDVVWSDANAKHVPVENISEDAWPYIEADPDLKLVKQDDPAKLKAKAAGAPNAAAHPLAAARAASAPAGDVSGGSGSATGDAGPATTVGGSTAGGSTAGTGRGRTTTT